MLTDQTVDFNGEVAESDCGLFDDAGFSEALRLGWGSCGGIGRVCVDLWLDGSKKEMYEIRWWGLEEDTPKVADPIKRTSSSWDCEAEALWH
jgi:hypothetical protein